MIKDIIEKVAEIKRHHVNVTGLVLNGDVDFLIFVIEEFGKALKEIAKGEGPFNIDPLQHASNCIENMVNIAKKTLGEINE